MEWEKQQEELKQYQMERKKSKAFRKRTKNSHFVEDYWR